MPARTALALALIACAVSAHAQSAFPYDRDMVLDARPMRGGKRVPILSVETGGRAQIDLWCKRGEGQAVVAGETLTIIVGEMREEACTPERAQADEDMLAALAGVTGWSLRGDVMTLVGAKPLRFRLATN
jgi:heat shock protein HslJ